MDHSQNGEATIVKQYFNGYVGTLLDCGANDGITFSNSYDLIQDGWKAVLLEPGPKAFERLNNLYAESTKAICINCGIGDSNEFVEFHESGAHLPDQSDVGLLSGTAIQKAWSHLGYTKGIADFITFNHLLTLPIPYKFDFITIDCEGMDWEILQQIDLKAVGCRCLCIEWNSDLELKFNYLRYTEQYGMKLIASNAENLIFAI